MSCYTHSCRSWLALKHFWNLPGIRASNCQFCVYNAVNCAETTIRYVVYFTNSTLSVTAIIFDSMTLFDVSLRKSTWTLFWSCRNHAYYLLIAVFLISLLPYALSALSSVSFFYSPFQTHNLSKNRCSLHILGIPAK